MKCLGLDIGGANIKAALVNGDTMLDAISIPFLLWQRPGDLASKIEEIINGMPGEQVSVSMTGEIADCYDSRREGVAQIVASVTSVCGDSARFYTTDGRFVNGEEAITNYMSVAAANWHALARYATNFTEASSFLLVDIGSTTTDIIPVVNSMVASTGLTDATRLVASELIYSGVVRSPVCALLETVSLGDTVCPVVQEVFATALDAYIVANLIEENSHDCSTADGKPATRACSKARLARMILWEDDEFSWEDAVAFAKQIEAKQVSKIHHGIETVLKRMANPEFPQFVVSGQGEFLARGAIEPCKTPGWSVISLNEELGPRFSQAGAACAVAALGALQTDLETT